MGGKAVRDMWSVDSEGVRNPMVIELPKGQGSERPTQIKKNHPNPTRMMKGIPSAGGDGTAAHLSPFYAHPMSKSGS